MVGERVAAGGEGWRKEPGASRLENTTMGFLHSAVSSVWTILELDAKRFMDNYLFCRERGENNINNNEHLHFFSVYKIFLKP